MSVVTFPYGKEKITYDFSSEELLGVLTSGIHQYKHGKSGEELVSEALAAPVGSLPLCELAKGKKKIVLIASDHTRPVPSRVIVPPMLTEIRKYNPDADVTILIATGCHRGTTKEELIRKFGEEIVRNEKIVIHDCDDKENLVSIGTLPSGSACIINRIAAEADLLVSEGFIEPHFFAGFSGGRKSILPGIASRMTVLGNHCSAFIADPHARTGNLDGNPIHRDMLWAAKAANLAFIVNVVIDADKNAIYAVSGDPEAAHAAGCAFLSELCRVQPIPADIAVTTNGGYPLDQNIYQSVKGMTAGEATVKEGGIIIMLSRCDDGHGGENFYRHLASEPDIEKTRRLFLSRSAAETVPDQWESQVFIRVLQKARVIFVSSCPDNMIRAMHMTPAHSLAEALTEAKRLLGNEHPTITAIPDGVSVFVKA